MSMDNYKQTGYGLKGELNSKAIRNLVSVIKELLEDIPEDNLRIWRLAGHSKEETLKDIDECLSDDDDKSLDNILDYFEHSPFDFIADSLNARNNCTGFSGIDGDDDNYSGIVYSSIYPWHALPGDLYMTVDKIDDILEPIRKALGWDIPDDQEFIFWS